MALVRLTVVTNELEAEMVCGLLRTNGIACSHRKTDFAAASEWHGSSVWRSPDLGETWTQSSEGLAYDADGPRKLSKVSTLAVDNGRVLVGVEAPGIFESRDNGATWSLLTNLEGQPGSEGWDDPANQPPGHLGISAIMFDRGNPSRFWAIVQGVGLFETADDAKTWTPRNRRLR